MPAEQVAARLDDRFRLLTGGSRTALPRHQTLRAVVDWSWDLLERRRAGAVAPVLGLHRRRRRWPPPSRSARAARRPPPDVLDLLTALVDKSLLTVRDGPDGPRYRMLETIRAYGQERLAEAGEQDAARQAHAAYFAGAGRRGARTELLAADQLTWLDRLTADHDNLHAAMRGRGRRRRRGHRRSRLAGALGWYWWLRGLKAEGAELIGDALTRGRRRGARADRRWPTPSARC